MDNSLKIKPISGAHSIKECVLTVFLASELQKPERFQSLIETTLKDKYQRFELIDAIGIHVKHRQNIISSTESSLSPNIGFRLFNYNNGELAYLIQGLNETESRSYISFHSFQYPGWQLYFNEFSQLVEQLSSKAELNIEAFSLHYVDEFLWNEDEKVNMSEIFNLNSDLLPSSFFENFMVKYVHSSVKEFQQTKYMDRLEVDFTPHEQFGFKNSSIKISHNSTQVLDNIENIADIIKSDSFKNIINKLHEHNKLVLSNVLKLEVQKQIGL